MFQMTFSQLLIGFSVVVFLVESIEANPAPVTEQEPFRQLPSSGIVRVSNDENETIDATYLDEDQISDMVNQDPNRIFFCDTNLCIAFCTSGCVTGIIGCGIGTVPTSGRCCRFSLFYSICKCVFENCPAPC